jgi:hypothetical protein
MWGNRSASCSAQNIPGRYYGSNFIPASFENVVLRHIIVNSLDFPTYRPAPLLLIQGKKGEGKSFMTEIILSNNNIKHRIISSSVLAGKNENDAVENLRLFYNACQKNPQTNTYSALVIDDFHLSIAISKENATHTTNADNLLSALMNIADRKEPLKAPIILIGNDFSNAYGPLTRLGRMTISTWKPQFNEKLEIVKSLILRRSHDKETEDHKKIANFVQAHKDEYIGFFEAVIENLVYDELFDVTNAFAVSFGRVNFNDLTSWVGQSTSSKVVTLAGLYAEAERQKNIKPDKFDGKGD